MPELKKVVDVDTEEIRSNFLKKLKDEVDFAFEKRALETELENGDTTEEQLSEHRKTFEDIKDKADDDIVGFGTFQKLDCEVVVHNPHDYKDLLKMAVLKFWHDEEYVNREVEKRLQHEAKHYVPLLGYKDAKLVLGVHFYQDRKTGRADFIPFVDIEGKLPVGVFRDAISAVSTPSSGDRVLQEI